MSPPNALVLHANDNVAVALSDIPAGARVTANDLVVHALDPIPQGHKVSLGDLIAGETVVKYGYPIGFATQPIARGAHVHVHNVESGRLRGDR